jgi:hypothetical protein
MRLILPKKGGGWREWDSRTYTIEIVLLTIPAVAALPISFGGNLIKHGKSLELEK